MSGTSQAQPSSAAAPMPSSPQMTAADSETAPLLSQDPAPAEATTSNADPEANAVSSDSGPPPPKKHILILTSLSLALSLISLIFIAATYILIAALPFYIYFYWQVENNVSVVVPITIIATILSLSNLIWLRTRKSLLPLIVNIVLDIIILVYSLAASITALNFLFPGNVSCGYETDQDECDKRGMQMQILMGIAMGAALGVGIVHSLLFILRCVEAYRTRFWRPENRPSSWRFPTGTFTVQFTIKILRQEREGQIRI